MSDFSATATAEGKAVTNTNFTVTATSSASAKSNVSYEDALNTATNLAQNYANETAKYDANLINQSTDISTYLINYNTKQISSAPDLTFYYSSSQEYTAYTETNLDGSAEFVTYNGPVFSDRNLTEKIGKWSAYETIFGKNDINIDNLYQRAGVTTFYLANGNLCRFLTDDVKKNSQDRFVTPAGIYKENVVAGTRDYLNKTGIIEMIFEDDSTFLRTINVYFNNN